MNQEVSVKHIGLSDAKANLSELIDQVRTRREPIMIQKHEKDVAVIVEVALFRRLQELEDRVMTIELREALKGRKYDLREVLGELRLEV